MAERQVITSVVSTKDNEAMQVEWNPTSASAIRASNYDAAKLLAKGAVLKEYSVSLIWSDKANKNINGHLLL